MNHTGRRWCIDHFITTSTVDRLEEPSIEPPKALYKRPLDEDRVPIAEAVCNEPAVPLGQTRMGRSCTKMDWAVTNNE